jgi:hypothetical protein
MKCIQCGKSINKDEQYVSIIFPRKTLHMYIHCFGEEFVGDYEHSVDITIIEARSAWERCLLN